MMPGIKCGEIRGIMGQNTFCPHHYIINYNAGRAAAPAYDGGSAVKLSMWMIANRLDMLEPEISIKDSAKATLRSARKAYATDCVYVYQDGADSVCMADGDWIRLKDMDEKQAFEVIQSVFDFYDHWNEAVLHALQEGDYDGLTGKLWQVLRNPIILMDANRRVISLSKQYSEDDLDEEWKYLSEFGYSSVKSIEYLRRFYNTAQLNESQEPKVFRFPPEAGRRDCMFAPIYYKGVLYGRISVLEESRPLNAGDMEIVKHVVALMGPYLEQRPQVKVGAVHSVFLDLVLENPVDDKTVEYQLKYLGWKRNDLFRVMIFTIRPEQYQEEALFTVAGLLGENLRRVAVFTKGAYIVAVLDESVVPENRILPLLDIILQKNGLQMGKSFCARGIRAISYLYRQSLAALHYGRKFNPGKDVYHFYQCAMDYILDKNGVWVGDNPAYACHPDVIRLWKLDRKSSGNRLVTLWTYLDNDRSLINTAQQLYIHRSTLVYRIKKLLDELTCDITDAYTRDYIKLSIRMLRLYQDLPLMTDDIFI